MQSHVDFAYPWYLTYGHLVIAAILFPIVAIALVVWSIAAFLVVLLGFAPNGRMALPTESFLATGTGRVLDLGAGSGRSTLMVLEARPKATLVALDSFSNSYAEHFDTKGDEHVGGARAAAHIVLRKRA